MGDVAERVSEVTEKASESRFNNVIGALVVIAATFLALCNVKDGNVVQAMAQAQSNSVDAWAYYQAKSTKQSIAEVAAEQLTLQRDTAPGLTPELRATFDRKIAELAARVEHLEADKEQIKHRAEDLQKRYDELNVHDDQFDMAEAALSIAIALLGITALTRQRWLLILALGFAAAGFTLGLAGFAGWSLHPDALARLLG